MNLVLNSSKIGMENQIFLFCSSFNNRTSSILQNFLVRFVKNTNFKDNINKKIIIKKNNKTDGCMRRLQQVSNINIINTKLITVTDIDSMSLHTGDRENDKF